MSRRSAAWSWRSTSWSSRRCASTRRWRPPTARCACERARDGHGALMEQALRNTLRRAVEACRKALEADYRQQVEARYGIHPDGRIEALDRLPQLDTVGRQ